MKLSLLDFLVCPGCREDLTVFPFRTRRKSSRFGHFCVHWCAAEGVRPGERPVGPKTCLRCHRREIVEGVLWCGACRRAFPIHEGIPELLTRDLENAEVLRDVLAGRPEGGWTASALLRKLLPGRRWRFVLGHREIVRGARARAAASRSRVRAGNGGEGTEDSKYKRAEVRLTRRKDLPDGFFNPGLAEPFVSFQPSRSIEKILRFMIPVKHADMRFGDAILDLGVGYAWTTEWLAKLGYNAIGVDLNRDYLRVGMRRTGGNLPPVVIADVENLPTRKQAFQGALFFDAFHHVADRAACLRGCADALVPGGKLFMAEPDEKHGSNPVSIDVMQTYGILEKGISEPEFRELAGPAGFAEVRRFPYEFGDVELFLALKPGTRIFTSRAPSFLQAGITLDRAEIGMKAFRKATMALTVRNEGDTLWLSRTADGIGRVRIGFKLKGVSRTHYQEHYLRISLPRDVAPGETVELQAVLPGIKRGGDYLIEVDGVDEGIVWFKDISHHSAFLKVRVKGLTEGLRNSRGPRRAR